MDIPEVYDRAMKIAISRGYKFRGWYLNDGSISHPAMRTLEFKRIFFQGVKGFMDGFDESNDPQKYVADYIDAVYPDFDYSAKNEVQMMDCM